VVKLFEEVISTFAEVVLGRFSVTEEDVVLLFSLTEILSALTVVGSLSLIVVASISEVSAVTIFEVVVCSAAIVVSTTGSFVVKVSFSFFNSSPAFSAKAWTFDTALSMISVVVATDSSVISELVDKGGVVLASDFSVVILSVNSRVVSVSIAFSPVVVALLELSITDEMVVSSESDLIIVLIKVSSFISVEAVLLLTCQFLPF
jgi:hypothetical protein